MDIREPELSPTDHAVILAAGRGSRLDPEEGYKLLVEIDGEPLLNHHLRNFQRVGVRDVTVVTGYRHAELDRRVRQWSAPEGMELHVAVNPAFDAGNGLSVLAGVDQARRERRVESAIPFWLTMSDHFFSPVVFRRLVEATESGEGSLEGLLVVDTELDRIYDLDDANKIRTTSGGELEAIGKDLSDFDLVDAGLFWCGDGFVGALNDERERRGDCSTSDAVRRLAENGQMGWFDLGDAPWQDVDTPGARDHAERIAASEAFEPGAEA